MLQGKVIRYALTRSSEKASRPGDAAVEWMHEALEDIAATALSIELASQEGLLRMTPVPERDLIVKNPTTRSRNHRMVSIIEAGRAFLVDVIKPRLSRHG